MPNSACHAGGRGLESRRSRRKFLQWTLCVAGLARTGAQPHRSPHSAGCSRRQPVVTGGGGTQPVAAGGSGPSATGGEPASRTLADGREHVLRAPTAFDRVRRGDWGWASWGSSFEERAKVRHEHTEHTEHIAASPDAVFAAISDVRPSGWPPVDELRSKPLSWVATGCRSERIVRRRST
jgi:hypothetical protein